MMAILSFLGWRGIAGLAMTLVLSTLLVIQKGETRHWKKQSGQFETLYHEEQAAFDQTVANYRAAAAAQKADEDAKNQRTQAQQDQISKEQSNDYETRLAAARAEYQRLLANAKAAANSGGQSGAGLPGIPAAPSGTAQTPGDRLSRDLLCTEQGIQLDELISWATRQHAVDPNK